MNILIQAFPTKLEDVEYYFDLMKNDTEMFNEYALYIHGQENFLNDIEGFTIETVVKKFEQESKQTGNRRLCVEFSAIDNSDNQSYLLHEAIDMFYEENDFSTEVVNVYIGQKKVNTFKAGIDFLEPKKK